MVACCAADAAIRASVTNPALQRFRQQRFDESLRPVRFSRAKSRSSTEPGR